MCLMILMKRRLLQSFQNLASVKSLHLIVKGYPMLPSKKLSLCSVLLIATLVMSCASSQKRLEVKSHPVALELRKYPRPVKVDLIKIEMIILTAAVWSDLNDKVESGDLKPYAYFCYSESDYIESAKWLESLYSYIKQQNLIIGAYEADIEYYNNLSNSKSVN